MDEEASNAIICNLSSILYTSSLLFQGYKSFFPGSTCRYRKIGKTAYHRQGSLTFGRNSLASANQKAARTSLKTGFGRRI